MEEADRPRVLAPPPLIAGAFFAAGYGLDWLVPSTLLADPLWRWVGGAAVAAGAAVALWALAQFRRARTPVEPWKPASALVTGGPYRFSRNPIYVAIAPVYAGAALWLGNPWTLALLVPALIVLHYGVILREETYLRRRFGADYAAYCARVRRWL
jgi:protein-S-isoprenylcysteine O-methyltransferase Ste14